MFQLFKQYFRNSHLKNKIIIIFVPLIVIPLLLLSATYYSFYKNKTVDRAIESISDNSRLITSSIEDILRNSISCANMLTINISNVMGEVDPNDEFDYIFYNNKIASEISKALVVFPEVSSVAFVDSKNRLYSNSAEILSSNFEKDYTEMDSAIDNSNGINIFFPMRISGTLNTNSTNPTLTIGKKIIDLNTGDKFGSLYLNIDEKILSSIFTNLSSTNESLYFIVDESNKIISSGNKEILLTTFYDDSLDELIQNTQSFSTITKNNTGKLLITGEAFKMNNWKLLTITPIEVLAKDAVGVIPLLIIITLLFFILAFIGANKLSAYISNPLRDLANKMTNVTEDNLDVSLIITSQDELGSLSASFLVMLKRIKELLEKVNYAQKKKREYELALISSQVKPHFLYNTLDTIYVLNEMNMNEGVQKTTKALADFYRAMLSNGRDIITIEDELLIIKNYLIIQNTRYSDVFDYAINVDPNTHKFYIPKFTLQPIVENAIYHGLKMNRTFGHLKVNCLEIKDTIEITISDNGIGMDITKKNQLFLCENNYKNSFGLYSVNERLKLYYGDRFTLNVDSTLHLGTKITIIIPKFIKEDN